MLLAIDTCGHTGGVALGAIISENPGGAEVRLVASRELIGRTFSEVLLSSISEILAESGVVLTQLKGIVVIHGPGSFTGIRIGVSAAKGFAEGLGIPVIAVSRLKLLADKAGGDAVAVLDAGRGEFFVGVYRRGDQVAESLMTRETLLETAAGSGLPILVCEPKLAASLPESGAHLVTAPTASDALKEGARRFRVQDFDDVATLDANYLRRSETEMLARIAEHAALRASRR